MTYKVSKLKESKGKVELVKVTEVMADRFVLKEFAGRQSLLFETNLGVTFYNDEKNWRGKVTSTLVAFLPGDDWVVEQG